MIGRPRATVFSTVFSTASSTEHAPAGRGIRAVLSAVVLLAGCLTACVPEHESCAASTDGGSHCAPPMLTPEAAADEQADSILGYFPAPRGATMLFDSPAGTPAALADEPAKPRTPDLIQETRWYVAYGTPASVLATAAANPPYGMRPESRETPLNTTGSARGATPVYAVTFDGEPVRDAIARRTLTVDAAPLGSGRTVLRLDAQVVWIPARPAGSTIPGTATELTAAPHGPLGPVGGTGSAAGARPVTTDDTVTVGRVAALIDTLPPFPPGLRECPRDSGGSVLLTFRQGTAGPVVATVRLATSGCTAAVLTVGERHTTLAGSTGLVARIAATLGAGWPGLPAVPATSTTPG